MKFCRNALAKRILLLIFGPLLLFVLASTVQAGQKGIVQEPTTWLWVKDQQTELGVPGASVEIGPGERCLGRVQVTDVNWVAHYLTGSAGRVRSDHLPKEFSRRVTVRGRELRVVSVGREVCPWTGPAWTHVENACQAIIWVSRNDKDVEGEELDYWSTTDEPTQFRAYIQDVHTGRFIPGVKVTALRSRVVTSSDAKGLFTLEVAASWRKGKTPPQATETLLFSKPGYRQLRYESLVLNPGVNGLDVILEKGTGTAVRRNGSVHNSWANDEFFTSEENTPGGLTGPRGEIFSLDIRPSIYEGGWILCKQRGAKAVVRGLNLKSVDIFWYSTGTGMGLMDPAKAGPMRKVSSSPQGDTWELELPDLMTTNFWAQGVDTSGNTVKSMDLGNVGWNVEH
jgi:hypothetical protein